MPHPVLRRGCTDYRQGCSFAMSIDPKRVGGSVVVQASFELASTTLDRMVGSGGAAFLVVAKCAKTCYRSSAAFDGREAVLKLDSGELADTLKLTPYVVSREPMPWFESDEHDEEVRGVSGGEIPAGSILAVGASHSVVLDEIKSVSAAIKMVSNDDVAEGSYALDIDGDFVVIAMHSETHQAVSAIRDGEPDLLYPSLYQSAIEYAIREMGEYPDSKWARSLRRALQESGVADDDDLDKKAHIHAQAVLKAPLGRLVSWSGRGQLG